MSTTYTWTVKALYTLQSPQPNYVVNCIWELTGTDGTHTASIDGNTQFAIEQTDPNFVPYAQLTQATVIGWVQAALGAQGIANFEANVQGQINSLANPPVSPAQTALPWSS